MANIINSTDLTWVGNTFLKCEAPHNIEVLDIFLLKTGVSMVYRYDDSGGTLLTKHWFRVHRDGDELREEYTSYVATLCDHANRFYHIFQE